MQDLKIGDLVRLHTLHALFGADSPNDLAERTSISNTLIGHRGSVNGPIERIYIDGNQYGVVVDIDKTKHNRGDLDHPTVTVLHGEYYLLVHHMLCERIQTKEDKEFVK